MPRCECEENGIRPELFVYQRLGKAKQPHPTIGESFMQQETPGNNKLDQPSPAIRPFWKSVALSLLAMSCFAVAYAQAPLYFSNQHQYFIHARAVAGPGYLHNDWLSTTTDPTPIFTALVANTYRFSNAVSFEPDGFLYVFYGLLMGVYVLAMLGLFSVIAKEADSLITRTGFFALFILVHSALVRCLSARLLGVDYPWYFQAGVAGQYVLGPMLQPSVFGVLLVLSVFFAAKDKPLLAVMCSSSGAVLHNTYMLSAAMLTVAYLLVLAYQRRWWTALATAGLALVIVLPIVIINGLAFMPTSADTFSEAKHILVHFRIPHHAIPRLWCDHIAWLQIAWMVLGIGLSYGTRLFPILTIAFVQSAIVSILQIVTDNDTLALLFPWRMSVIVLPIATTIILSRLVAWLAGVFRTPIGKRIGIWVSVVTIFLATVSGLVIMMSGLGFQTRDEELAMMKYVRDNAVEGDRYLLPVRVPNLEASVSGSQKSDFRPLKKLDTDKQFILVNLQRFRMYTGVPIFVDFKSIPYKDEDVLEWRERLKFNEAFYEKLLAGEEEEVVKMLRELEITHVVVTTEQPVQHPLLKAVYAGKYYRVFKVPEN